MGVLPLSVACSLLGFVVASISFRDVEARYELLTPHDYNLKRRVVRAIQRQHEPAPSIDALRLLSVDIPEGSRVGLVGANGSGKSTFLAIAAGVLPPTAGQVKVQGRVLALLGGAGAGLSPEASGRDNVVSLGVQLGETPAGMRKRFEDIAEFSGLGARIDHPVYSYSSGMQARLRFSILTSLRPDVLLLDEGIATADAEFTERANERLAEFMSGAGIVILASHGDGLLRQHCTTAIWLDRGVICWQGDVETTLANYHASFAHHRAESDEVATLPSEPSVTHRSGPLHPLEDLLRRGDAAWIANDTEGSSILEVASVVRVSSVRRLVLPPTGVGIPEDWAEQPIVRGEIRVTGLSGCYVLPESGVVIRQDGAILQESLGEVSSVYLDTVGLPGVVTTPDGKEFEWSRDLMEVDRALVTHRRDGTNRYSQFVLECLPAVAALRDISAFRDHELVFPALDEWQRQHLQLMGISTWREIQQPAFKAGYAVFTSTSGHYLESPGGSLLRLRARQLAAVDCETSTGLRLLVARIPDARRVLNWAELEAELAELGFVTLDPTRMNVAEQIEMFACADAVVGVSGPSLVNTAYAKPDALICEIQPTLDRGVWVRNLAVLVGARYLAHYVPAENGMTRPFTVDVRGVMNALGGALP